MDITYQRYKEKVYTSSDKVIFDDISRYSNTETLTRDQLLQEDYVKNRLQSGDESKYLRYHQMISSSFIPYETPNENHNNLAPNITIQKSIESVVANLENFYSTILSGTKDNLNFSQTQYVIQRYNLGSSYLEPIIAKTGRKVYVRKPIDNNEQISVKSIVMLPKSVFHFSNIHLPYCSILMKSEYAQNYLYLFKLLNSKLNMDTHVINDFDKEMDKDVWENALTNDSFNKNAQHFVLDDNLELKPKRFEKFMQSIVPDTQNVIRLFEKFYNPNVFSSMLSVQKAVKKLEPFLVYLEDINYSQYNALRYFIKEKRKEYLIRITNMGNVMATLRDRIKSNIAFIRPYPHNMEKLFDEKKDLSNIINDLYDLHRNSSENEKILYLTPNEWVHKIYKYDNGVLFYNMVRLLMSSLVTPKKLIDVLEKNNNEEEDMSQNEKIKAGDCVRRILTKKYHSLKDLQSDNTKEEIYYDKEYDDTPYDLLDKYKDEHKRYSKEEFKEFLEETLVQKHDCPPKLAPEMAENIVEKKKLIRDGEYALLEIAPHLPEGKDLSDFSEQEKKELLNEANILKKEVPITNVKIIIGYMMKQWMMKHL